LKKIHTFENTNPGIMIQRVQSVYLLLVTVLMSFMLILPYAELTMTDGHLLTFLAHGIEKSVAGEASVLYKTTIAVIVLVLITALLSFGNIFLFSRRILQLRLCLLNITLLLTLLIIQYVHYSSTKSTLEITEHSFRIPAIFPLISIIFNFLAYRHIHSDEMLVNSYSRLR